MFVTIAAVYRKSVTAKSDEKQSRTRNQYASPPRGNVIPAGPQSLERAILAKFCVVEPGFADTFS